MNHKSLMTLVSAVVLPSCFCACQKQEKMNVLFIIADDLRPELGCYGFPVKSPNIDQLAAQGTVFHRAYCSVPVSGASRASLLTGTRPTRYRFVNYDAFAQTDNPQAETLPNYFRKNGYYTIARGKVFHYPMDSGFSWNELWSPYDTCFFWRDYQLPENIELDKKGGFNYGSYPFEMADVDDTTYYDGKTLKHVLADLEHVKKMKQPFFLAVGFRKPHLPFNAPKKYWDLYRREDFQLPDNYRNPNGSIPKLAYHNFGELRGYYGIPAEGEIPDSIAISLLHGYHACISYVDYLTGQILSELERLDMRKNTIVVLIGDNGWNLGEHGLWCKHANFHTSLSVPMIVSVPGMKQGQHTQSFTEFIDIFPTLLDLCGLKPLPQLEGKSFVPVLNDENHVIKEYAVCKWKNGLTLRMGNYSYTEWRDDQDKVITRMLFDYAVDPAENNNIAELPENKDLVNMLSLKSLEYRGSDYLKKQ